MEKMPVIFAGHGSPATIIEDNNAVAAWRQLGLTPPIPKDILVVSAHWYTNDTYICTNPQPETIYDFYGFQPELYEMKYEPPGAVNLAHRVKALLGTSCRETADYGLDHGAWCPLKIMYPEAIIPVTQLSVNGNLSFAEAFTIGEKLSSLRDEGVLILGSGDVVHNLRAMDPYTEEFSWAKQFDDKIYELITEHNWEDVINIKSLDPEGCRRCLPTPDHFLPLLYCLGAASEVDQIKTFNRYGQLGSITLTGYVFA